MKLGTSAFLALLVLFSRVTTLHAIPIISVDLDPGMAGVQSTHTVNPGDIFTIDVWLTGDGTSAFDSVGLDVAFNDLGAVLGLGPGLTPGAPTAGSLAATSPTTVDVFGGFVPVTTGSPLTPDFFPFAPGFAGGFGGLGMTSLAFPFPTVGAGVDIGIFSLTFRALTPGTTTLLATGFPFGTGSELALASIPVLTTLAPSTITVASAGVPEPATLFLFVSGLAALVGARRAGKS